MALTFVTPDGTVVTTIAGLADWAADKRPGANGTTPTTATFVVDGYLKPGVAIA